MQLFSEYILQRSLIFLFQKTAEAITIPEATEKNIFNLKISKWNNKAHLNYREEIQEQVYL